MSASEADVVEGTAIEVYEQPAAHVSLFRTDDPVEVIEKATAVADALKSVVASRGLIANIKGKEHPKVEAWQTLGSMLGVAPVKEWVRQIPWPNAVPDGLKAHHAKGRAFGYEASFIAMKPDGAIVGGGEARCDRTEDLWSTRDDYALMSMAQTRATSKALKGPLGFVMSLAGYETTPAEEMPTGQAAPAAASSRPFGDELDPAIKRNVAQACVALCNGDSEQAMGLFKEVGQRCGGYMPQAAGIALLLAAVMEIPVAAPEIS